MCVPGKNHAVSIRQSTYLELFDNGFIASFALVYFFLNSPSFFSFIRPLKLPSHLEVTILTASSIARNKVSIARVQPLHAPAVFSGFVSLLPSIHESRLDLQPGSLRGRASIEPRPAHLVLPTGLLFVVGYAPVPTSQLTLPGYRTLTLIEPLATQRNLPACQPTSLRAKSAPALAQGEQLGNTPANK